MFICNVVSAGISFQLVLILTLIFGWTLSVRFFIDIFWQEILWFVFGSIWFLRLLLIHVLLLTWSSVSWINSVYLLCCFQQQVQINLYPLLSADICLNIIRIQDIALTKCWWDILQIVFGSLLAFEIAFDTSSAFDLIYLSTIQYCQHVMLFQQDSSSQLVGTLSLIFGWTPHLLKIIYWYLLVGNHWNLFLDQFGFRDCFWYIFCFWLDLV